MSWPSSLILSSLFGVGAPHRAILATAPPGHLITFSPASTRPGLRSRRGFPPVLFARIDSLLDPRRELWLSLVDERADADGKRRDARTDLGLELSGQQSKGGDAAIDGEGLLQGGYVEQGSGDGVNGRHVLAKTATEPALRASLDFGVVPVANGGPHFRVVSLGALFQDCGIGR